MPAQNEIANEKIIHLTKVISEALKEEWEAQGHKMTGAVVQDIEYFSNYKAKNILEITAMMYPYGLIVQAGVKKDKIPYTPGARTGAGTSKYIQALIQYASQRMGARSEANAKQIAFAIAAKHKKEGMPTGGSYAFTKTGKRLDWIIAAFKRHEEEIIEAVTKVASEATGITFDLLITKYQKEFNTT